MKRDESDSKFEIQKLIDQNEIFVVEAAKFQKDIETNESQIQNLQNLNGASTASTVGSVSSRSCTMYCMVVEADLAR